MHAEPAPASQPNEAPDPTVGQQFTEADLIAADLHYLESQKQRDERRLAETMDLERAYVARRGWAL